MPDRKYYYKIQDFSKHYIYQIVVLSKELGEYAGI
jgi:hypothetical protein